MKKENVERAEEILEQLAALLFAENLNSPWGRRLTSLANKKTLHVDDFRSQIKGLYGGMGSLNDIVLFRPDGKVDRASNEQFAELKNELYQLVSHPHRKN